MADSRIAAPQTRPPLWRNATFIKWATQIGVLVGLSLLGWILLRTVRNNLEAQGLELDWDFLTDPPGIQLAEGIYTQPETGLQAFGTAIVNMLRVTVSGVIAATILGVLIGVSRLSSNWLLSKAATVYIEIVRNIPLLIQIVFWFFLMSLFFPTLEEEGTGPIPGWLLITRKGVSIPWLFPQATFWQWLTLLIVGFFVARWVYRQRLRRLEETGSDTFPGRWALGSFLGIAILGWFTHPLAGALGWLWALVTTVIDQLPLFVFQLGAAGLCLWLGLHWILRFLDSRRTGAGLAKLTDDDYFRMGLVGLVGVVGAVVLLVIPNIMEVTTEVLGIVFNHLNDKFDFLQTGSPLEFGRPGVDVPGRFPQLADTGMTLTPNFFGVWVGVTLYTAAFIAEIVRAGILAVPVGQNEAGNALGLRRSQVLRMIVLPQAFRVILPPMGNQYLNLAKNTSLGIGVGYAEMVQVGQTLFNQTGDTIQVFLIWMGFYLSVSLVLSVIVNYYNRKLKLVER